MKGSPTADKEKEAREEVVAGDILYGKVYRAVVLRLVMESECFLVLKGSLRCSVQWGRCSLLHVLLYE